MLLAACSDSPSTPNPAPCQPSEASRQPRAADKRNLHRSALDFWAFSPERLEAEWAFRWGCTKRTATATATRLER